MRTHTEPPSSEITPEKLYLDRRAFIAAAGALGAGVIAAGVFPAAAGAQGQEPQAVGKPFGLQANDKPTPWTDVTTYNNFYEFGTDKSDPSENAGAFKTKPWTVRVDGLVAKPADYQLEDFLKPSVVEDRIYRHRCVEAWSMVVPWRGIPLADVIKRANPSSKAKFVEFTTLMDPKQMPGERTDVLTWPYTEGLRLDEAQNPLAFLAVGVYGRTLPNQNGAPLRLIVPWKYGFKGIKSIVRVTLTDSQPKTAWNLAAANEYGFYANVNPTVDHPRWSQATERRIGEFFKRKTLMFNGYTEQVGSMYAGMDLRRNF